MRSAAAVMVLLFAFVAAVAVSLKGGVTASPVVQDLGVIPTEPVASLRARQELCEGPVGLLGDVAKVTFFPGAVSAQTPAIEVRFRAASGTRRVLASGVVPAGFDPALPQTADIGSARSGALVSLCFRNRGPGPVTVFGDDVGRPTLSTADARLDGGAPLPRDVAATFSRSTPQSLIHRVPAMMSRASVFRPGFMSPGVWWVLLGAWLLLLPVGVVVAVTAAQRGDD
jgi:hypothetical protein